MIRAHLKNTPRRQICPFGRWLRRPPSSNQRVRHQSSSLPASKIAASGSVRIFEMGSKVIKLPLLMTFAILFAGCTMGPTELILIFAILLLLFGASKLPALGKALGETVRGFKKEIKGKSSEDDKDKETAKSEDDSEKKN